MKQKLIESIAMYIIAVLGLITFIVFIFTQAYTIFYTPPTQNHKTDTYSQR